MANTTGKKFGGRAKGTGNKSTENIKAAFQNLVEGNLDNISRWMMEVAADDPAKALEFMHKFSQFSVPMLARTEVTGKDGDGLGIAINVISQTSTQQKFIDEA